MKSLADIILGIKKILHGSKGGFRKYDQIYFEAQRSMITNFYVLCKTNSMVWSKLLMDIILGVRMVLHGSRRVSDGPPYLLLSIFELQRSVIFQFVCTLQYKSNGVFKITYGHHYWCQKGFLKDNQI